MYKNKSKNLQISVIKLLSSSIIRRSASVAKILSLLISSRAALINSTGSKMTMPGKKKYQTISSAYC